MNLLSLLTKPSFLREKRAAVIIIIRSPCERLDSGIHNFYVACITKCKHAHITDTHIMYTIFVTMIIDKQRDVRTKFNSASKFVTINIVMCVCEAEIMHVVSINYYCMSCT